MDKLGVWLAVALGGGLGSVARFALSRTFSSTPSVAIPWGTLAANLGGCLAIGLCFVLLDSRVPAIWKDFVRIGFLGGLTTFSTFSIEVFTLADRGHWGHAAGYALASLGGGLGATALGVVIGRQLVPA